MALEKKVYMNLMTGSWIADKKYGLSGIWSPRIRGRVPFCPITVPETVDNMLMTACQNNMEEYTGMFKDLDFFKGNLRLDLIWGYLSKPTLEPLVWRHGLCPRELDYESPEKASRLEGELKRWAADLNESEPRKISLNPHTVNAYCTRYVIKPIEPKIMQALGF
jgi:hypothetical protein